MLSRRQFTAGVLATAGAASLSAAKINSTFKGVTIGAQSYSFRDGDLDKAIASMKEIGIGSVELWSGHVEPKMQRNELRNWRETVALSHFEQVRKKLDDAGIQLWAYNYSFRDDFSDKEMARGFEFAKALGVTRLTASSNVSTAARIDPYASKAKVYVGMHNHSNLRPNEFATAENFAEAMKGKSKYIAVNLDIGHFVAAGFDPIEYLPKIAPHVVSLHIKDRKKNQGANVVFGEGDTPIHQVLQLMAAKKYKFPANIEYEYKGADTLTEVKKCFEYCKKGLA
ncbi:sugar phosphate isomerase/epimerase family protein [Bryobacter aggregatus]|uniref:sugar phosphate isomerase/epimerase family protein n=1 Tax=Bryobacter aggregatus TaxID=360054 RepID=UPI0004E0BDF9|nr:sugar phosphate isomerase/epimerase family protein [Bryobacter aggregatus]